MASRWWPGELPVELMQNVLLRVPQHDLGGSRVVSKAWNHMVMHLPGFVPIPPPESCVLTAIRKHMPASRAVPTPSAMEIGPWQLLDITRSRSRTITDGFIREGLVRGARDISFHRRTIATSGGLIYAVYEAHGRRRNPRRFVFNPVCRSFHQIPVPPGGDHDIAAMVVDYAASQRYRIVQIRGTTRGSSRPGEVYLYDSWDTFWTTLCDAPAGATRCPTSCVVLDGTLYALFLDEQNRRHELFSCDLETGNQWRLVDISLPRPPVHPQMIKSHPQVVAAAGCLFMVGYSGNAQEEAALVTIWRIALRRRPCLTMVAGRVKFWNHGGIRTLHPMTFPMVAVGCGDSIVVSSFTGRRVKSDVVRGTWHRMTPFLRIRGAVADRLTVFVGPISHLNMRTMPPQ